MLDMSQPMMLYDKWDTEELRSVHLVSFSVRGVTSTFCQLLKTSHMQRSLLN